MVLDVLTTLKTVWLVSNHVKIYECPGAITLLTAHKEIEDITLVREVSHFKPILENELVRTLSTMLCGLALRQNLSLLTSKKHKKWLTVLLK